MTTITLYPSGRRLQAGEGTPLRDVLFAEGVEFPCGGRGRCKGCRVKVSGGTLQADDADRAAFSDAELADGWRLACRHTTGPDLTLELAQWEMAIAAETGDFVFTPREGLGIAVDLGTTTLAAQLVDRATGRVLAAKTALNAQGRYGADVLTRVAYATAEGAAELTGLIRAQVGAMVAEMAAGNPVCRVVVAGNSIMHHLFGGLDITPLASHPFLPHHLEALRVAPDVEVLPCIGGLVGGDVLAGVMATGLHRRQGFNALVDLGTNGEVVVARDGRMVCTSTAAGPAFEGARISCGMRAAAGAIDAVDETGACRVIGGGAARGLCGSGLIDAVAAGLELGRIAPSGRMERDWPLADGVVLTPRDVRELQLAKGAIAAGLALLTARFGATPADLDAVYLAGAFGNAVSRASAVRTGLLRLAEDRIVPAGNTALHGAKLALFEDMSAFETLARQIEYVALNTEPGFEEAFAEAMTFN